MMQNGQNLTQEIFEMPPELSALEAALGSFHPAENPADAERIRSAVLLEQCRLIEAELPRDTQRTRLIETIRQASKDEISLSLNQYAKQLRFVSTLTGGVIGFFLGILFAFLGIAVSLHWLTPPASPQLSPIPADRHYLNPGSISPFDLTGKQTEGDLSLTGGTVYFHPH